MWAYQNALSSHGPFLEGLGSDEIGVGEFWPLQNFMTCTWLVLSPRLKKNSSLGCYLVCCASLPGKVVRKGPSLKPISVMVIFYKRLIFLFYVILLLACFLLLGIFLFLPSEIYTAHALAYSGQIATQRSTTRALSYSGLIATQKRTRQRVSHLLCSFLPLPAYRSAHGWSSYIHSLVSREICVCVWEREWCKRWWCAASLASCIIWDVSRLFLLRRMQKWKEKALLKALKKQRGNQEDGSLCLML